MPLGVAVAALTPQSAAGAPGVAQNGDSHPGAGLGGGNALLALPHGVRALAGMQAHSSHSSHASHASHFSSSGSPPPAPPPPVVSPPSAGVATTRFSAVLVVSQEVPQPNSAGSGASGSLTATLAGRIFHWRLTFAHLSGQAVAAVVHVGARGHVGARLVQLCGPCVSGASGTIVLSAAQVAALLTRSTYLNLGSSLNPRGEVRGQLVRHVVVAGGSGGSGGGGSGGSGGGGHFSHSSHVSHASHASHFSSA